MSDLKDRLLALGHRYHIYHPFHEAMYRGECTREQIQQWVINRYYYQSQIPRKDAAILANCPDPAIRRVWVQRILDQDGFGDDPGGLECWLLLGDACGVSREELTSFRSVLPSVRFAVDAYLNFAKTAPWQEAICSSLTELFAPKIHQQRLDTWPQHYPWINADGLVYFKRRVKEARHDVSFALDFTLSHFKTEEQKTRAAEILGFKLNVLWSLLDALQLRYGIGETAGEEVGV